MNFKYIDLNRKKVVLLCSIIVLVVLGAVPALAEVTTDGYTSPEEAVVAYYHAIATLNATELINTTQLSEAAITSTTEEDFKQYREKHNVQPGDYDYDYCVKETSDEYYRSYRQCIFDAFADINTHSFVVGYIVRAQNYSIVKVRDLTEKEVEYFSTATLLHISQWVVVEMDFGSETDIQYCFCLDGRWYVFDPMSWHIG